MKYKDKKHFWNYLIIDEEFLEDDDEVSLIQIVNPENSQDIIYAYVPSEFIQEYKDEKDLTRTTGWHSWSSPYGELVNKYKTLEVWEEDFKEERNNILKEWNTTELGSRYPLSKDDIEFDYTNQRIDINKEFNVWI